jgi:hypothetical protein
MIPTPKRFAALERPLYSDFQYATRRFSGEKMVISAWSGSPPIAATSLRVRQSAFHPTRVGSSFAL